MAVDANEYLQDFGPPMKPSTFAALASAFMRAAAGRTLLQSRMAAVGVVFDRVMPYDGVIEMIRSTQAVVGGGAAQNVFTLTVNAVNSLLAAGDGNTFLGNAAAGTSALTYPTDDLTAQADGVNRLQFSRGDRLLLTVAGANHSTAVDYEIQIAPLVPSIV